MLTAPALPCGVEVGEEKLLRLCPPLNELVAGVSGHDSCGSLSLRSCLVRVCTVGLHVNACGFQSWLVVRSIVFLQDLMPK